jgi:CheY-like chemotaxis protein
MKKQILIIEDQLSTRKLLCHYLSHFYGVVEKENAKDALQWLESGNKADAIVADILMPEMTGVEFLSALQNSTLERLQF